MMRCLVSSMLLLSVLSCSAIAGPIQFIVAEFPGQEVHNDSYVISIDEQDSNRLRHARALVEWIDSGAAPENSPGSTIVVAISMREPTALIETS